MKIKYHGHSCFSVISDNYTIVLDPYKEVEGYDTLSLTGNEVICSHGHSDHGYKDAVKIIENTNNPFTVETIHVFHDDTNGSQRGLNDINVLCAENKKVVHMGDLGHMLDEDIINSLKHCDVLMIPVGGFYTIDHKQALELIKQIEPKYIIPMHYRDGKHGFDVLESIDDFINDGKQYEDKLLLVKAYEKEIEL